MNKQLLLLVATATTISFTACNRPDQVKPTTAQTTATSRFVADEFAAALKQNAPDFTQGRARAAAPTPDQVWRAFNVFDLDYSGQLSSREIQETLQKLVIKVSPVQSQQLIKMFDANNSGLMEFNEFERFIEELGINSNQLEWFIRWMSR